ncbi:MAG: PTS glucose transporter subunit IIA, partial [Oscillibacter sp.]|nr:PTS glucose transporter subunit IIA [Oscillibacter sp.]
PFKYHVKADQEVKKGDLLLTADLDAVTKAGKKLYTPVIVTNSDDYTEITPVDGAEIKAGDKLMTVK